MKFLQRTKRQFPTIFQDNGSTISDRVHIANTFNVFFTNIGEKIANGIDYVGTKDYNYFRNKDIHSSFTFVNIDEAVVEKTINNIQAKVVVDVKGFPLNC